MTGSFLRRILTGDSSTSSMSYGDFACQTAPLRAIHASSPSKHQPTNQPRALALPLALSLALALAVENKKLRRRASDQLMIIMRAYLARLARLARLVSIDINNVGISPRKKTTYSRNK